MLEILMMRSMMHGCESSMLSVLTSTRRKHTSSGREGGDGGYTRETTRDNFLQFGVSVHMEMAAVDGHYSRQYRLNDAPHRVHIPCHKQASCVNQCAVLISAEQQVNNTMKDQQYPTAQAPINGRCGEIPIVVILT